MTKVRMIDVPSGWKYGFPKVFPDGVVDATKWLLANGYPQHEIDSCGGYFFVRTWDEETAEEPKDSDISIVLELTKREADAILELACTVSWTMGDYGPEMKAICRALEKVIPDGTHQARAKTWFGDLEVDQVFLVDKD
jgi:hypothetical protein